MPDALRRAHEWIVSDDCGVSSRAIWAHMIGVRRSLVRQLSDHPLDPSDFGRCYRLLQRIPEWRLRIGEMAIYAYRHGPGWPEVVAVWEELEGMWQRVGWASRADDRTYDRAASRAMYDRMKELLGSHDEVRIEFGGAR